MTAQDRSAVDAATRRKAVAAAVIGNFVEWYDFVVYAYFATVLATLFFPSESRFASLMATFAVFGVSFVLRPLGALVIGSYGDRLGRRNTLAVVILLISGATFLIGVLPTYGSIGILAPLLLAATRAIQGFSVGGEFGGATSFMIEYAPEGRRGLYGSWQFATQGIALITGATLGILLSLLLSEETLFAWGWRVPFLIALPFGLIGMYLRLRLEDTPHFRAILETERVESTPLRQTLRTNGGDILKVIGTIFYATAIVYLFIYMPTYLPEVFGISRTQTFVANVIGLSTFVVMCFVVAVLSERVGRKPFLVGGPLCAVILTYPAFLLLQGTFPAILLAHIIFGFLIGFFGGVSAAAFSEWFPTRVRYSALSLGYSVSVSIFGGTSPLIFTYLLQSTGNPISPAFYILGAALVSLVATLMVAETAGKPLPDA
jgi:MHS family proline/betaine transporter-like MFS transporter